MLLTSVKLQALQQAAGSVRGTAWDKDFDVPLAGVQVQIVETGRTVETGPDGHYVIDLVPPGTYTLVFTRDGYTRQVKADVVVTAGQLTDVDVWLSGEFTEMDEIIVQDILSLSAGSEASLLKLRLDSSALMDSIGSELMSRAGAGDAASALKLVAGASLQNGKSAVIRGLPDRYVSTQLNGVRLPSADDAKRAVELDQYPAAAVESIQVSKTFTPDQQGDASGGAVNVRLKGIPDESIVQFSGQVGNTAASGDDQFLTYDGGGIDYWGNDSGSHDLQFKNINNGKNWNDSAGVEQGHSPANYKWSFLAGGKEDVGDDMQFGGLASVFYERKNTFFDDGKNDSMWVNNPGEKPTPQYFQGTPQLGSFSTALYDVTKGVQAVQWGGLATLGFETKHNSLTLAYLYTRTSTDTATLAQDTRGKAYYFPGYDPNDPLSQGNDQLNVGAAPYLVTETLDYIDRSTSSLQLSGRHVLGDDTEGDDSTGFLAPVVDWMVADSAATLNEPDKRQFGSSWLPPHFVPGIPFLGFPPSITPPVWGSYKPASNFTLGNMQHIFKEITEDGSEHALNLKFPFRQWTGNEGYLKFGTFGDTVDRTFKQETFSNFSDTNPSGPFVAGFDELWSTSFPTEIHNITASQFDDDYDGKLKIDAQYGMVDLPLDSKVSIIGGERFESTHIGVINHPESQTQWYPPGSATGVTLHPGDADVDFNQDDTLPSIGLVYTPTQELTFRGSYSETVARQTFKELTPVIQSEYLGGPTFIGNPELQMSALKNYDLRLDYVPEEGTLLSVSQFRKDIKDPIEYVQQVADFTYTTAVNYPHGELSGYEFEVRQPLLRKEDGHGGLSAGANATLINSQVTLPADEAAGFAAPGIDVNLTSRDMTNAPDHLYNLYLTYDADETQLSLFYTVTGDTLVAGAGQSNGHFVPNIYAKEYGTLNFSASRKVSDRTTVQFQAKNLTDPSIEEVYRTDQGDTLRSTFTRGREFTLGFSTRF